MHFFIYNASRTLPETRFMSGSNLSLGNGLNFLPLRREVSRARYNEISITRSAALPKSFSWHSLILAQIIPLVASRYFYVYSIFTIRFMYTYILVSHIVNIFLLLKIVLFYIHAYMKEFNLISQKLF